jgi:hypothetical protein
METDSVPDVFKDFFISPALGIASLEFRAECSVPLLVFFYDNGKAKIMHVL